jgi:hypothetical protein
MQRILSGMIALAVAAFAVYGFLASFEPGPHLIWKIGYGMLFVAAVGAGLWSFRQA